MKYIFTEEDKKKGINAVEIEDERVTVFGEALEGDGKTFVLTGTAEIDGERYHDFKVQFITEADPASHSAEDIMAAPWQTYDFLY